MKHYNHSDFYIGAVAGLVGFILTRILGGSWDLASMDISILIGVVSSYKHSYPHNNRTKSHGKLRGDVRCWYLPFVSSVVRKAETFASEV